MLDVTGFYTLYIALKKFTTQGVVRIFYMLENTEVLKKETNKKDLPHPIEYPPIAAVCWWCLGKAE